MDEEKDLSSGEQEVGNESNIDDPVGEQKDDVANDDSKAGNGYNGLASSNRAAFARRAGNKDYYNERINNAQNRYDENKNRAANPNKTVSGEDGDTEQKKSFVDKAKDKMGLVQSKSELMASKIDNARSKAYQVTHPIEAAKMVAKAKIKALLLPLAVPIGFGFLCLFALFVGVLFVLGLFGENNSNSSFGANTSGECGFTISSTSFSKMEYKQKVCEYAEKNSKATEFCQNADSIYDLSRASNINPELVVVRAVVEGFSPAYDRSGNRRATGHKYNFWGIGCSNKGGLSVCHKYGSFLDGVKGFIDVIDGYDSLIGMMSKYAYIGKQWGAGSSADGECYYFKYIKDYYANTPEAQKSKANAQAACAAGGTGIPTTQYDQDAYALYQVDDKMAGVREKIFGLKMNEGVSCTSRSSDLVESYVNWMINFAADDSHGYSQSTRKMNPNVDCSSFVYYGLLKGAGFSSSELGGSWPFTTATMVNILKKNGFKVYKYSKNDLIRGDILWRVGHTEVYVGDGKNVGAHSNRDGVNGDSSGKEVNVAKNYGSWTSIIRYEGN